MAEVTPPLFMDVNGVYSGDDFGLPYRDIVGEGCLGYEDFRVRERAAGGANMSVDIGAGSAWIMGDEQLWQPNYRCRNDALVNKTIAGANGTLPRIDSVIAEVLDATFSGVSRLWRLRVVDGTATAGATLDNRTGAAALPNNAILLADVLVPAGSSSVVNANIRDRRPMAVRAAIPTPKTDVDMVVFEPAAGQRLELQMWREDLDDLQQGAFLVFLPRRIVGATRLRWNYIQDNSEVVTGNYVLGIYDASGRKIVDTGSVAFTGALSSNQTRAETITATTFEAGYYYLFVGLDISSTGVGDIEFRGLVPTNTPFPNYVLRTAGGAVAPTTLLGLSDVFGTTDHTAPVPLLALSVG